VAEMMEQIGRGNLNPLFASHWAVSFDASASAVSETTAGSSVRNIDNYIYRYSQ